MIDSRNSVFDLYKESFSYFPEQTQDRALSILASLPDLETLAKTGLIASKNLQSENPKVNLFNQYAPRFSFASTSQKDELIALFAKANFAMNKDMDLAVKGLLSLKPSKRPQEITSTELQPKKKRVPKQISIIKNREPLPLEIQKLIISEKLYLELNKDASSRIAEFFGGFVGDTALSSAYQTTGKSQFRWPANDYYQGRISEATALQRVMERFTKL